MNNAIVTKYNQFEEKSWAVNKRVCGIDEVGRGCLAGPVVVAGVILHAPPPTPIQDSKKISAKKRVEIYNWLINNSTYTVCLGSPYTIDRDNIYQATRKLMARVWYQLTAAALPAVATVDTLLVDAMPLTLQAPCAPPIYYFNKGESWSVSIAAASIVAKVTRDRLISEQTTLFPSFNFAQNKAYGTAAHQMTLRNHHATIIHRQSFIQKINRRAPGDQAHASN